jgi:SnoaL-like polyketide cyclase
MFFSQMRTAFPDLGVAPEALIADDESIPFAYTLTGTHQEPLGGITPTGRKVKFSGLSSGLQSQANTRPHSTPRRNWRDSAAPSGVELHPKLVESWNRTPANDVAAFEDSYGALARLACQD